MSRPPKPVIERKRLTGTVSVAPTDLQPFSQRHRSSSGSAPLEQRDEQRAGEPDDVEVVALDPLDEPAAEPLDRVAAGAPLPLAARDVAPTAASSSGRNVTTVSRVVDHLAGRRDQAEPGQDRVRAARELAQHRARRRRASRGLP